MGLRFSFVYQLLYQTNVESFYAEDFDNVGLLVGDKQRTCTASLITHDVTIAVVEEAMAKNCNVISCVHSIILKGIT